MTDEDLLELARGLAARGVPYALVTVVRAVAPTSAYVGAQAIVLQDGTLHGWIGGGCARGVAIDAAREAIARGEPKLVRISNDQQQPDDAIEQHAMACASNGTIELFVQPRSMGRVLCVLGSTPAADEARFLAERLGLGLADSPDQAPVVLIATQGQGDEDALESALRSSAAHVLMVASRRKAERLRDVMRMRGIEASRIEQLAAPAGPDAGARTPREIALVSIAGVLAALRSRSLARDSTGPREPSRPAAGMRMKESVTVRSTQSAATFVNPVCGVAVSTENPRHVEEYEGVSYYFCCDGCWTAFLKEPAKYAAIHRASVA